MVSAAPAQASIVQWQLDGVFTSVVGVTPPPQVAVGLPFSILVSFDSDAVLNQKFQDPTDGSGYRYRFSNSSLGMTFTAGSFGPQAWANEVQTPIILRDNFAVDPNVPASPSVDGIFFGLVDAYADQVNGVDIDFSYGVGLRTFDLGQYNITNDKLPLLPPALNNMQANFFDF